MMSKTSFTKYFLIAFTLMSISSGLSAGTFDSDGKKKDKEKKEELSADGPYVLYQPDGKTRVISVDKKGKIIDTTDRKSTRLNSSHPSSSRMPSSA